MCNKDHTLGMKHMDKDCVFIRPSGNPLTMEGWNQMMENLMENPNVSVELNELVSINKIQVCGNITSICML